MNAELFREYDGLIGLTMVNLYSLSKANKQIELGGFNKKNREHLFLLRVALLTETIHKIPVYVQCSIWDWIWINLKEGKGFNRIRRIGKPFVTNIDTQDVLDFMRSDGIERCGGSFNFGDIYSAYYERKKS